MCSLPTPANSSSRRARPGHAAAHVAAVTFDVTGDGLVPVARSQSELIAGGVAAFLEAGLAAGRGDPVGDPARLVCRHRADFGAVADRRRHAGAASRLRPGRVCRRKSASHDRVHRRAAGPRAAPLADAGLLDAPVKTILALWRAPERLAAAAPWQRDAALVDIASFGETDVAARPGAAPTACRRRSRRTPRARRPHRGRRLSLAPKRGRCRGGGRRSRRRHRRFARCPARPAAGRQRPRSGAVAAELQARGVNPLIAGAFRPRRGKCRLIFRFR